MLSNLQWKRLQEKTEFGDCWVVPTETYNRPGIWVQEYGRPMNVHRAVWEHLVGPLDGLDLLHQCGNTRCWNPDHMQPMSRGENRKLERRTRCKHGHLKTETNTRRTLRPGTNGDFRSDCKVCDKLRKRKRRADGRQLDNRRRPKPSV